MKRTLPREMTMPLRVIRVLLLDRLTVPFVPEYSSSWLSLFCNSIRICRRRHLMRSKTEGICAIYSVAGEHARDDLPVPIESTLEVRRPIEEVNFCQGRGHCRVRRHELEQGACAALLHADDNRLWKLLATVDRCVLTGACRQKVHNRKKQDHSIMSTEGDKTTLDQQLRR